MTNDRLPFRAEENALIRFGDAGKAPILSYNVPQPAEYNGRFYLELLVPKEAWSEAAQPKPAPPPSPPGQPTQPGQPPATSRPAPQRPSRPGAVPVHEVNRLALDLLGRRPTPSRPGPVAPRALATTGQAGADARPDYLRRLDDLARRVGEDYLAERLRAGARIVERRTLDNRIRYDLVEPAPSAKPRPRLAIVHLCRMSSFLGDYGAGRTVSTFSLLPGEKHEIEIKTFKRTRAKATEASSILDSFEETKAEEFQEDLTAENSSQNTEEENFNFNAEAEGSATWGWGQASASAGVSGGTAAKREEFAKNVASTTQKHAATAAAKRQVEVNTTSETETEEGEESAIRRTIENINVGRTLNFVFRQMNQVFVTVLHVVDVRIAFRNGDPAMDREYTLPELPELLERLVVPAQRQAVAEAVWQALFTSFDWRGEHRPLVEAVKLVAKPGSQALTATVTDDRAKADYWRFRRQTSTLDALEDGAAVTVPGVVLNVTRSTLPTDGVIVEALLGQGNALDAYSLGLQMEAVREKLAQNDRAQAELDLLRQKVEAVAGKDAERIKLLAQLFPPPKAEGGG